MAGSVQSGENQQTNSWSCSEVAAEDHGGQATSSVEPSYPSGNTPSSFYENGGGHHGNQDTSSDQVSFQVLF